MKFGLRRLDLGLEVMAKPLESVCVLAARNHTSQHVSSWPRPSVCLALHGLVRCLQPACVSVLLVEKGASVSMGLPVGSPGRCVCEP